MLTEKIKVLDQYFTASWVAKAITRQHFSDLSSSDFVIDPMCGPGRFLEAVPAHVPALGIEIDPEQAELARKRTGRPVITGDIRSVVFPERPSLFLGNPPFKTGLFDEFLKIAHQVLVEEGRIGMLLPCYFFQTASRVVRYNEQWSLYQEMVPRNIYPKLEKPLCFAIFTKDQKRLMVGFSLFHEQDFVNTLSEEVQSALVNGPSTWGELALSAIRFCGGEAELAEIYEYVSSRRPSQNPHWKEQIRKVCQQRARRTGRGRYAVPTQASLSF